MRNIYQEKRIDRLKTQGIKHEVTTCITCPSTTPNPIASYIGVMTLQVQWQGAMMKT